MAVKARAEITLAVVNDGKSANTFWRYSDDNGKTFTKDIPLADVGTPTQGRNLFTINRNDVLATLGANLNPDIHGITCTMGKSPNRVQGLWRRFGTDMPRGIYRVSGKLKTDGSHFTVAVELCDNKAGEIIATEDWKPFSFAIEAKNYLGTPYFGFVNFKYGLTQPSPQPLNLYVRDLMITQGEEEYKYTPAPEDQRFGLTQGKFLGVASWGESYPPMEASAYQWTKVEGKDAELYRLHALEETAVVDDKGACKIVLRYEVHHIVGDFSEK